MLAIKIVKILFKLAILLTYGIIMLIAFLEMLSAFLENANSKNLSMYNKIFIIKKICVRLIYKFDDCYKNDKC